MIDSPIQIILSESETSTEGSSKISGRVILFSFPNEDMADQWYSSEEYKELSSFRREGTDTISIFKVKGQLPRS